MPLTYFLRSIIILSFIPYSETWNMVWFPNLPIDWLVEHTARSVEHTVKRYLFLVWTRRFMSYLCDIYGTSYCTDNYDLPYEGEYQCLSNGINYLLIITHSQREAYMVLV